MSTASGEISFGPKVKWGLAVVVLLACVGGVLAYVYRDSGADVYGSLREMFLGFLQGRGAYERVAIAALVIGLGNAVFIPINILLLLAALFMPAWHAFIAGMVGAVIAALMGYLYGQFISSGLLKNKLGPKYEIIQSEISDNAFTAVVLLCFAPVAPNIATNVLAGICKIPIWKLVAGTIVGFLPGVAIITLLGRQMRAMLEDPGYQAVIGIAAVIGLIILSYKLSKRVQKRIEERAARAS